MKEYFTRLQDQWESMLARGIMPLFEIELAGGEYLLVDLTIRYSGILFEFDGNSLPTSFSGDIKKKCGCYFIPFEASFTDLDHYLQQVYDEILEGYLIPNDLLPE